MQKLYLIRHGQTDWNARHKLQGHSDIPLNSTGLEQAQGLAHKLKHINLDRVISSDLIRAIKTAEVVNSFHRTAHTKFRELREINLGLVEGLHYDDAEKILGADFWTRWLKPDKDSWKMKYPLGESKQSGLERFQQTIYSVPRQYKNVAIVSHGLAIRGFMNHHFPAETKELEIRNASALVIQRETHHLNQWKWVEVINPD